MAYERVVFYPDVAVIQPLRAEYKKKGYRSLSQYLEDIVSGKIQAEVLHGPGSSTSKPQPSVVVMGKKTSRGRTR